jgi:YbbR domain-containing protein
MNRLRTYGAQFVLGLLLAITLWTYVSFTTNPNSSRQVITPIRVVGLPAGLMLVDPGSGLPYDFADSTVLTISGPLQAIREVTGADFQAVINLGNARNPDVLDVRVTVDGPELVRVLSLNPSVVTVRVARELVKTVPVRITPQGQPPFSYTRGPMTQGAEEAVARGPEELVQRVVVAAAAIDLQGQTVDLDTILPLQPVDEAGDVVQGVTVNPERVSVHISIEAQLQGQQVSVVPRVVGQPAPGYVVGSIDWDPKIVEVVASGVVTSTFSTEAIDITGLTSSLTTTVSLERPPNAITRPPTILVTVRVSIMPISVQSQLPLLVPVSPVNLEPGLVVASADPSTIQVTVAGPFEQLSQLSQSSSAVVVATVDLSRRGPGTYVLPVRIGKPDELQIVAPLTPRVRVTIARLPTPTPEPSPLPEATPAPTATSTP